MNRKSQKEIQVTTHMVRQFLQENEDTGYRDFHSNLLPGVDNVMGIRLPVLRKFAKQLSGMDWQEWFEQADDQWYEETMLRGLVSAYAKMECKERLTYVAKFVPDINNWAVCDCFCSTLKDADKYQTEYWDFIEPYFTSDKEYEARFAAVMLLGHFVKREYLKESIRRLESITQQGYYAKMACKEGLIGMSVTNSEAIMVPTFGRLAMLGSNPIAVAMPAEPYDFLFDASTTVVTRGKVEVYNKKGAPLPDGWTINAEGKPCSNAAEVLENINEKKGGGILPLGGGLELTGSHKGYGYGMLAEIFSSILSLGLTSNHTNIGSVGGTCHGFVAINPNIFGDPEEIKNNFSAFLKELRESPKAYGQERIYTHGEKEVEAYAKRLKEGIPVNSKTLEEMRTISNEFGVDMESYLGKLDF